jgi:hypothetical protein
MKELNRLFWIGGIPYAISMSRVTVRSLNNAVIDRTMWLTYTHHTHSHNPAEGGWGSPDPSALAGESGIQKQERTFSEQWRWVSWKGIVLGLLLFLLSFLALMPQTGYADGVGISTYFTNGPGNIQVGGFRITDQYVYAYVGVGQKIRFDIRKLAIQTTPNAASDLVIRVYSPTGQVYNATIDGLAGISYSVNNKGSINSPTWAGTATTAGIWTIRMTPANDRIYWGYDIDVLNSANAVLNGHVYTESMTLGKNATAVNFNLYHINDFGYEYTSTFANYLGVDSGISTNRYGLVKTGTCVSAYVSAINGDPKAKPVPASCGGRFKQFFTAIDQTMPVSASKYNVATATTVTEWLNPTIANPAITGLVFSKTPGSPAVGNFAFTVTNYAGNATLQIDANNDGDYVDATDRNIPFNAVEGSNTLAFDGLNGQGVAIGCGQTVGARVLIDKAAEIHFTLYDVEGLGGLRVTRTNGASPNSILYWDDRSLTNTGKTSVTPNKNGTTGINSAVAGGVHGWAFTSGSTWGDTRHIDNWAFAAQSVSAVVTLATVCDYGDAPASYSVTTAGNGPSHATLGSVFIGATVDAEANGTGGTLANGDDTAGTPDDEDGITTAPPILIACTNSYTITVPVSNSTGTNATLGGWVDFNRNGVFDASEFTFVGVPNGATTATLTWSNIQTLGITAGQSYIRLRISTQTFTGAKAGGSLINGEVEDYPVSIEPALQAGAISTTASACATPDGSISLTATGGGGSFEYSIDGGVTYIAFTSPASVTGLIRGGYTVIIRDAIVKSCLQTYQLVVDAPKCCDFDPSQNITGQAVNPGAGITVQYLLTTTSGQILETASTPSFTPQAVGSYYIRILGYNTASPAPTGVTVGQNVSGIAGCCFQISPPTPIGICTNPCNLTLTASASQTAVCEESPIELLADVTPTGSYTYTWSGPNGFNSSLQNPTISVSTTANSGSYTLVVTDGSCIDTSSVSVSVGAAPTLVLVGLPICNLLNVSLTFNTSPGATVVASSGIILGNTVITIPFNTNVTLTATGANGCVTVLDVVSPNCTTPCNLTVLADTPVCDPGNTTYSVSVTATGATSLNASSGTVTGTGPEFTISGIPAGVDVILTPIGSCTNASPLTVTAPNCCVAPATPVASVTTQPTCITPRGTITISAPLTGVTFSFDGGLTFQASNVKSDLAAGTNYNLMVKDNTTGCLSEVLTLTINPVSNLRGSASSNSPVCSGNLLQLFGSQTGGTAPITYSWSGPNSFASTQQNPSIASPTAAAGGSYTLTVTDATCSTTVTTDVTIATQPDLVISGAPSLTICSGQSTVLNIAGDGDATVTWSNNLGQSGTGTSINFPGIANISGQPQTITYFITASAGGCSDSDIVQLTINPAPALQVDPLGAVICALEEVNIVATSFPNTAVINWTRTPATPNPPPATGTETGTATINQVLPAGSYSYSFTATQDGCTSAPKSVSVVVNN